MRDEHIARIRNSAIKPVSYESLARPSAAKAPMLPRFSIQNQRPTRVDSQQDENTAARLRDG
jgi:hypothetical protein